MTGYTFTLTCPHCGGVMRHVADGAFSPYGSAALASCTECGSQYRADVRLRALQGPALRQELLDAPPGPHEPAYRGYRRNLNAEGAPLIAALIEAGA